MIESEILVMFLVYICQQMPYVRIHYNVRISFNDHDGKGHKNSSIRSTVDHQNASYTNMYQSGNLSVQYLTKCGMRD